MIRTFKAGAVALALGTFIVVAPTAHGAVLPAAGSDMLARSVVPMPSSEGGPQSATQMLHLAQRRGGYRGRRRGGYDGYRGRRHRGGRWVGPAIGAGIAAVIIGGAIASSKERYRDRWERCDDEFRTFSWEDGTYIPYVDSPRVLCPYLRD